MKIRLDFVTNSSSSSYVCEICGYENSGFDTNLEDLGFCQCVNGHIICRDYHNDKLNENLEKVKKDILDELNFNKIGYEDIVDKTNACKTFDELIEMFLVSGLIDNWSIPASVCPVCQQQYASKNDLDKYKTILIGKSDKKVSDEMLKKFKTYDKLKEFLNKETKKIEN